MEITVIQLLNIMPSASEIIVRRAFGDDDGRQYRGTVEDFPTNHEYANREVFFVYPHKNGYGDVCTIKDADSLDIAVGDFNINEESIVCRMY